MPSLQYVIDTICSKLTVDSIHVMIKLRLAQGPFMMDEIIPLIQSEDRSLDRESAKMLAEAAFEALVLRGDIGMEGDCICPRV